MCVCIYMEMGNGNPVERVPTKIVFLDIDGVLNSYRNALNLSQLVDKALLKILKRILDETGAVIVLSSNWRYYTQTRHTLNTLLTEDGIQCPISCTPRLECNRLDEIIFWLQDNTDFNENRLKHVVIEQTVSKRQQDLPESQYRLSSGQMHVTHWIAIDDMDLCSQGKNTAHIANRFIHVDMNTGLTEANADLAIKLLNQ